MAKFSKVSEERKKGLHPDIVKVLDEAIINPPHDFGISQGVRTKEQQEELFAQGRTKPGKIVTRTLKSNHMVQEDGYGHAFDVVIYINGKVTWDEKYYDELARHILQVAKKNGIALKWGGQWAKPDKPHYELLKGK